MTSSRTSSAPSPHRRRSRPRGPAPTSHEHGAAAGFLPAQRWADDRPHRRVQLQHGVNYCWKEMLMRTLIMVALILTAPLASAQAPAAPGPAAALPRSASPPGAEAYIISPKDGATVKSPVLVQFGLKGMGVAPAGVKCDNTGHHHLLIDTDAHADPGAPLPATDKIVHFGKGQTEASVPLSPGKHTLQLLLGDQNHVPHNPPVISTRITITVAK